MLILIAGAAGILFALACRRLAFCTRLLNYPNPIVPQHVEPVPYLGGVAIALAAALAFGAAWLYPPLSPFHIAAPPPLVWLGGLAFLLLGLADDASPFSPFPKLALQCGLALALLLGLHPSVSSKMEALLGLMLYTLWIVTVVNAVNFMDVCDGLLTGLCCIALAAIVLSCPYESTWALALLGACAGFLVLNFPPAKIYLGDAGSHFLGYSLATITLPDGWLLTEGFNFRDLGFGPLLLGSFLI